MKSKNGAFSFVLFGATGDLAVQKIFPALAALHARGELSGCAKIIAVSRRDWGASDLHRFIALGKEEPYPQDFLSSLSYAKIDLDDASGYEELAAMIEGEPVVYLSLAPQNQPKAVASLKKAGILAKSKGKVFLEKPFGVDEKSAHALNKLLGFLKEEQIYRIDHYLGKATVRSLLALHKTAPHLSSLMTNEYVSSMRVRFYETVGMNGRGASYDGVGAFRDVGQNHMLEMLAALAVESPDQKGRAQALRAIMPAFKTCSLSRRGQYEGYRAEEGVAPQSETETAFEVTLAFSRGKLKGVPVVLEGGKGMSSSEVFVQVTFKNVPEAPELPLFIDFNIRPREDVVITRRGGAKDVFNVADGRDAYENVILSGLRNERECFVGKDEIEALWRYADQVVACWSEVPLQTYDNAHPF